MAPSPSIPKPAAPTVTRDLCVQIRAIAAGTTTAAAQRFCDQVGSLTQCLARCNNTLSDLAGLDLDGMGAFDGRSYDDGLSDPSPARGAVKKDNGAGITPFLLLLFFGCFMFHSYKGKNGSDSNRGRLGGRRAPTHENEGINLVSSYGRVSQHATHPQAVLASRSAEHLCLPSVHACRASVHADLPRPTRPRRTIAASRSARSTMRTMTGCFSVVAHSEMACMSRCRRSIKISD